LDLFSRSLPRERSQGRSRLTTQGTNNIGEIFQDINSVHLAGANKGVKDGDRLFLSCVCWPLYRVYILGRAIFGVRRGHGSIKWSRIGRRGGFSKKLSDKHSPLYLMALSWLIIAASSLPISLILGERQLMLGLTSPWLHTVCYALASLLGFWAVIVGVRHIEASIVASWR
jgi:hypothetical protein